MDGLEALVLEGKTTPPPFDDGYVSRAAQIGELRSGRSRLVTVTAPAGYGKTSFLGEWRHREDRAVGWLSLSADDDDPATLVHLIAHACAGFAPDAAPFVGRVSTADGGMLAKVAPALALALSRAERPFTLFIDDAHVLRDLGCIDALSVVLAGVPAGSQAVLASRHRPSPFMRGRLASSSTQVDAETLRIDLAGAADIAEAAGARVDDETLRSWVEQCDGWAAGLHMCALLSRSRPFTTVGDHAELSDYLYQECMHGLPDDTRRFLVHTSILPLHIPELCDAVLERSDSASILRDLEARQLFVTADRSHHAYRLHPLFREYLQNELRTESISAAPALHARASAWFLERGQVPSAIEHAIAGDDFGTAAMLVAAAAIGTYESGQVATLARWVDEIGDANLLANPASVVVVAWLSLLAGSDASADKWTTMLGRIPDRSPSAHGIDISSAKAMVRAITMREGLVAALADAEYAVAAEPLSSPWRDPALQVLGSTLLHTGDEARARTVLAEAAHTADAHGNPATIVMCETELALLAIEAGDGAAARERVGHALARLQSGSIEDYVMSAYAHAAAACVEFDAGRREAGGRMLRRAMSERGRCHGSVPLISIPTRLLLVRASLLAGDGEAARMLLHEIDGMLPPADGRAALDRRIAAARLAVQEREQAGRGDAPSTALTVAEQRVLPYLQTHLTRPEIAERLFVSKHTVVTQIAAIFRKLGVSSRSDAVKRAIELGLLAHGADIAADG